MVQLIPSMPIPFPPPAMGISHVCPQVGHLPILLEAVKVVPFPTFHYKIYLLASIKTLLPIIVFSSNMEENQSMYCLKSLKEKILPSRAGGIGTLEIDWAIN